VKILAQAATIAKSVEPAKIRDALATVSYDGHAGSYAFGEGNDGALTAASLDVFRIGASGWGLQGSA
jgi:hypothetical protein